MRKCDNAFVGEKITRCESSDRGCIVIMEQPIARAPQFRSFSPNVLLQTAKNFAVELGVHVLAFGYKFMVHNPSNVEKHDEHVLGRAAALPRLLRFWGSWALPLRRLLFSLGIILIDPTLVPSDDPRHEGWVIHGTPTKLLTNCSFCSGVRSLGTNFASTRYMFKSHVRIVCTVPYNTLTIAAMSLMVLRRSSCTSRRIVLTFLGVELVEGRPDLSSSSSHILPLLKRACHSKHLTRLVASFLYARRVISKVSVPDLPSFTQNLMFALCSSFTSMLKSQMWRHTWWLTLLLCNSQCSHSDATRHAEWWRSLLPSTAHSFTYCHRLAVYGTSLETFWYTLVSRTGTPLPSRDRILYI